MGEDWSGSCWNLYFTYSDILDEVVSWSHLKRVRLSNLPMVHWSTNYYVVVVCISLPLKFPLSVVTYNQLKVKGMEPWDLDYCYWKYQFVSVLKVESLVWPVCNESDGPFAIQELCCKFQHILFLSLVFFCVPFWCWKDIWAICTFWGPK